MNTTYDVIVIGAGMGGMTVANKLARNGHSVLIIEQHDKLGGLAGWFQRKKHIFDVSLHGFPAAMKNALMMHWNDKMADSVIRLGEIRFDNPQFSFETTYDAKDFKNKLKINFNLSDKTINDFFISLQTIKSSNDYKITIKELFDNFFPKRNDIIRALLEPITYANGLILDDPAIIFAIVFLNFMDKGIYTFQDGTNKMLKMMHDELIKNKVDIVTGILVQKIKIKQKHAYGVFVNNKLVKAKAIISNSDWLTTIHDLAGDKNFSDEYIKETNSVRRSDSCCQVYVGMKKDTIIHYIGDIIFASTESTFNPNALLSEKFTSHSISVYYPKIKSQSKDYTIVSTSKSRYNDWAYLSDIDYREKKEKLINSSVDAISKYIPKIRDKIDYVEAATPRTFQHYTLHPRGSSFGTKFEGLKVSMDMPKQVNGLFHVGSVGIIASGWLGTANYGAIVSYSVDRYLRNS